MSKQFFVWLTSFARTSPRSSPPQAVDFAGDHRPVLLFENDGKRSIAAAIAIAKGPLATLNDTLTRHVLDARLSYVDRFATETQSVDEVDSARMFTADSRPSVLSLTHVDLEVV